ncbi:MAG: beta-ketoacyl-ACP synthase III [Verrucomicrobium sp.]|nr:beta-ketoacyl-ACP synthase III [Verrucomicrobium sp.]
MTTAAPHNEIQTSFRPRRAYITRLSKFLPNEPVPNDEMELTLGMVNGKPSRARSIVLRNNRIKTRYYALKDGKSTHGNAEMAALAVKGLFDDEAPLSDLQILAAGTTTPEQLLPSHAAMIHGLLGSHELEIVSTTGACLCSFQGLKYAYMAIVSGLADSAACVGSEKLSTWMHASRFQPEGDVLKEMEANPILAFDKDFLRWMLSDGAAAALVQSQPASHGVSLRIEWMEITSYAHQLESCMYAGSVKQEDGSLKGWNDMDTGEWLPQSVFSLKQDTRLLGDNIVPRSMDFLQTLMQKHGLTADDVDHYLPHMSSEYFKNQIVEELKRIGMDIPLEKWFYNLTRVGNVGSASAFLMLEELFHSGRLKKGERILVMVPESARFSYANLYLTVV